MQENHSAIQTGTPNKLADFPIRTLILSMGMPMVLSMVLQAVYNIVDTVFVSHMKNGATAVLALTDSYSIQLLIVAVGVGTGIGINALLSKTLGERNSEKAACIAGNGIFLAICIYAVFLLFGIFGAEPYMRSLTPQPETVAYGVDYIRVICIASFGIFGEVLFERLLQSTGRTTYTMITQGTGAIINIILDPILIFGYFGLPRMEVTGAAVATVIGQIVAFFLAVLLNKKKNTDVHLSLKGFRPSGKMIGRILGIGVPSMLMIAIGSLMTYSFNLVLDRFNDPLTQSMLGETGKTVFGAYFKLQSFIFMPVFGINNAVLAISAYNYGARKPERITSVIKYGILGATAMMLLGTVLFLAFPDVLLDFFNPDAETLAVGEPALRIMCIPFLAAGVCIIFNGVYQGLGKSQYSMYVSMTRQLIVLIPVAYLLSLSGSMDAVWFSFPIAEVASLALSILLMLRLYRKKIRPLSAEKTAETT